MTPERAAQLRRPPELLWRTEDGLDLPYLLWRLPEPARVISSAVLGGGIGERHWVLNAQVRPGYDRLDPAIHLVELASRSGLVPGVRATGPHHHGVGLLTAADVEGWRSTGDGGVQVDATVGVRVPTWAAAPDGVPDPELDATGEPSAAARLDAGVGSGPGRPGTINVVAFVPVPCTDGALVNLVATATEAKAQALLEAGVPGTGTATDAVCVVTPTGAGGPAPEPFGGPRSVWGARLGRAVHAAVSAGVADSFLRMGLAPREGAVLRQPGGRVGGRVDGASGR